MKLTNPVVKFFDIFLLTMYIKFQITLNIHLYVIQQWTFIHIVNGILSVKTKLYDMNILVLSIHVSLCLLSENSSAHYLRLERVWKAILNLNRCLGILLQKVNDRAYVCDKIDWMYKQANIANPTNRLGLAKAMGLVI